MPQTPASGEQSALRGYHYQYYQIALRVYEALVNDDFYAVRLADPRAGRVDDLVLIRRNRVDAYQFKSSEFQRNFTFRELTKEQRTHNGANAPSLLRSLADGWQQLRESWDGIQVHLVTQQLASINDQVVKGGDRPSPNHFGAFLKTVLVPLRQGTMLADDVDVNWKPAIDQLRDASKLPSDKFDQFVRALHIDVADGTDFFRFSSLTRKDIETLASTLMRHVSEAHDVVELKQAELLELVGWQARPRLQSRHEFPVNLDTYHPLAVAIQKLQESLAGANKGYIAVIGPPGSGKSTLLSQALSGCADRIVRYYAYVPGYTPRKTRLTAQAYLHDIVLMLNNGWIGKSSRELPATDVNQLRQQLAERLDTAGQKFQNSGHRTIVIVDGLDHVSRDHSGDEGLLGELPRPEELPDGVIFVVGSRTLAPLNDHVKQHIQERESIVDLQKPSLVPCGYS